MKNVQLLRSVFFASVLSLPIIALSATEYSSQELSCRAKAKEVAAEAYRGCVTEFKSAEIERLHKNYQKKLKALKDNYEKEVETLSGEPNAPKGKTKKIAKGRHTSDEATEVRASAPNSSLPDESSMDIPEPVPVEN